MRNPFKYFNSSPEVIRLTVLMHVGYPLSLRQVEDLLFERGIDICRARTARRRPVWRLVRKGLTAPGGLMRGRLTAAGITRTVCN